MFSPRTLTNEELFRFAQGAALESSLNKAPWTPIQQELLARYMVLLDQLHNLNK